MILFLACICCKPSFGYVKRMDGNRLPTKVLHCNVGGKRNRGRRLKTWINNIKGRFKYHEYRHAGCSRTGTEKCGDGSFNIIIVQ